ncbi:hypothetical protein VPH35_099219 [Triticum aestivum]
MVQTPTVVHKGYAINRICQFYMSKVLYTRQNFYEKLSTIIDEFRRLDDIHPFYVNLLHVLYNMDHYKLFMGQINTTLNIIGKISKDYLRLLKYGDTLYRYKCLKVAALGRMFTVLKRISPSLAYLEQIRQHMARLPSIDPNNRTILIYYKYLRYQVIDTPGILDRPFEDMNIIQMCSITALAHLRVVVLFFLDISGSCGYTIAQQAALFHKAMKTIPQGGDPSEEGVLLTMSALTDEGVMAVKNAACERLLEQRVEIKMKSKKINDFLNRFHVSMPKPHDNRDRPTCIHQAVLEAQAIVAAKEKKKLERDLENENGGAGVYSASLKKHYLLANDEWNEDILPEILDGHNVADFFDPDILERCEELQREEGLCLEEEAAQDAFMIDSHGKLTEEHRDILGKIRKKAMSYPIVPRKQEKDRKFTIKRLGRQLTSMGVDPNAARERSLSRANCDDAIDADGQHPDKKLRTRSRSKSKSRPIEAVKAIKKSRDSVKNRNKEALHGEADRVIPTLKPKHLFSGRRGIGKTSRH